MQRLVKDQIISGQQVQPKSPRDYAMPTPEQEALQPPDIEPSDFGNLAKSITGIGSALVGSMALSRVKMWKQWLKDKPNGSIENKEAAMRMLKKAQSEHAEEVKMKRAYGTR